MGQKRFSLEGAESLIPALDAVIEKGAEIGIQEFVIGMAHRGRLNVLANILHKTYEDIFSEFERTKSRLIEMQTKEYISTTAKFLNQKDLSDG